MDGNIISGPENVIPGNIAIQVHAVLNMKPSRVNTKNQTCLNLEPIINAHHMKIAGTDQDGDVGLTF